MSEYEIPAEVLEQAAAAARNNATKDLSFDLGGWDTAPEVVREQWRTVVRIAAPLIAADAYRAGQAATWTDAGRLADRVTNQGGVTDCACPNDSKRSCGWRAGANEVAQLAYVNARDYVAERSR